jgi:predicted small metal-binding protein
MKPMTFKNRMNGERFVCDDVRTVEVIEGVEYLIVHRPNEHRVFKMRKDALERIKEKIPQ